MSTFDNFYKNFTAASSAAHAKTKVMRDKQGDTWAAYYAPVDILADVVLAASKASKIALDRNKSFDVAEAIKFQIRGKTENAGFVKDVVQIAVNASLTNRLS